MAELPESYFEARYWLDRVLTEGDACTLSANRIQVLDLLLSHTVFTGPNYGVVYDQCSSQEWISRRLRLGVATVRRCLGELEEKDYIRRSYRSQWGMRGAGNPMRIYMQVLHDYSAVPITVSGSGSQ